MNRAQQVFTILIAACVTVCIRALPFLIFRRKQQIPAFVRSVGEQLPRATMMMLIVYCLKDVSFTQVHLWLPAAAGILVTVLLQVYRKKMMLSVFGGTMVYMLMLRWIA